MDMREQVRKQARKALEALSSAENEWEVETGCEAGWDFIERNAAATVEEVQQEARWQMQVRQQGEAFRLSFISAALGGIEGLLR